MAMRRGQTVAALVALLLGARLIAYPYVSDFISKTHQIQVVDSQDHAVENANEAALEQEMKACIDFNARLYGNRAVVSDPFDPNNQPVTSREYEQRLNLVGDGVMGTLVIPKIDVTMPIYHGTGDDVLQNGVGHMQTTSLPVGGASTHTVLAGHNGLPSVRIFDDIEKLHTGDYFVIQVLGEDHAYRVTGSETVLPEETDSLAITEGKDEVTLVTCVPYGVNTHRLLVHAERCEVPQEWLDRDKDASREPVSPQPGRALLPFTIAGIAVAAGVLLGRHLMTRRARRTAVAGRAPATYPSATRTRKTPIAVMPRVGEQRQASRPARAQRAGRPVPGPSPSVPKRTSAPGLHAATPSPSSPRPLRSRKSTPRGRHFKGDDHA